MSFYTRTLKESATYWPPPLKNAYGDRTYPSPATISCHWEEKAQIFIERSGVTSQSHAVVLLASEIEIDGRLFHGKSEEDNPDNQSGADVIRMVERCPTIRGDVVTYRALL